MSTETASVVIVGGGLEGVAAAWALGQRGITDVIVCERDTVGGGMTGKSSGIVRCHYGVGSLAAMAAVGLEVFEKAEEIFGSDIGFRQTGYVVGVGEPNVENMRKSLAAQRAVGVQTEEIDAADVAGVGDADGHRQADAALRPVPHLRDVGDDLLERGVGVRVELHLDDRAHARHRHADRGSGDAGLGERGVPDALGSELLPQAFGDAEDPAEAADVLAVDDDVLVLGQGIAQGLVERLRHRHRGRCRSRVLGRRCVRRRGHAWAPASSASHWACCSRRAGRGFA